MVMAMEGDSSLVESSTWELEINQVEDGELATGGSSGLANKATGQLANRSLYLKDTLEDHTGSADIHRTINDSGSSSTDLWSASKIQSVVSTGSTGPIDADTLETHPASYFATNTVVTTHTGSADIHRTINDSGSSSTDLWSASKIQSVVSTGSTGPIDADTLETHPASYFATSSSLSSHTGSADIHRTINDSGSSSTDLWSASKINSAISAAGGSGSETASSILTKLKTVDGSGSGLDADLLDNHDSSYFATSSSLSSHTGSAGIHRTINDSSTSSTNLWSASKINSAISAAGGSGSYLSKTSADTAAGEITFTSGIKTDTITSSSSTNLSIDSGSSITLNASSGAFVQLNGNTVELNADNQSFMRAGGHSYGGCYTTHMVVGDVPTWIHGSASEKFRISGDTVSSGILSFITPGSNVEYLGWMSGKKANGYTYLLLDGTDLVSCLKDFVPEIDDTFNLGMSSSRWNDIYATNGSIQTSDERQKEQITPLGSTELDLLMSITPFSFKWKDYTSDAVVETETVQSTRTVTESFKEVELKDGKYTEVEKQREVTESVFTTEPLYNSAGEIIGEHKVPVMEIKEVTKKEAKEHTFNRTHYGVSSQQLKTAIETLGLNPDEIAAFIYDSEADTYGVRYTEFIPLLIKAVQDLSTRVQALENSGN